MHDASAAVDHARTLRECNAALAQRWRDAGPAARPPLVLEAGGGSFSHFHLPTGAAIVALDIDFGQLARNAATPLRVQGDLHALPIGNAAADVIVCFNVIEHLEDPKSVLRQFADSLRRGGTLILGCPSRNSLKGIVTRLTPVGWHRAFYRHIVGKQDRGGGHYDAFATPFKPVVARDALAAHLRSLDFELDFVAAYDGAYEYGLTQGGPLRRMLSLPYYALGALADFATAGQRPAVASDLLIVAPNGPEARASIKTTRTSARAHVHRSIRAAGTRTRQEPAAT